MRKIAARGSSSRNARKSIADASQKARELRSPKDQLGVLDRKLGKNKGAQRERKRLKALFLEEDAVITYSLNKEETTNHGRHVG